MYPFKVFISHKVAGHGNAVSNIKDKLEDYGGDKLSIFVSPALRPGEHWIPKIHEEIEAADLFILLYLVEGVQMDWCLYEAGYFEREALKTNKKLISVVSPNCIVPGPFETRQRLDADEKGIENLLREIFNDENTPVRPDLFDVKKKATLDELIQFIIRELGPVTRKALNPRLWITITEDQIQEIQSGNMPENVHLMGETEALKEFGIGPDAGISLKEFVDISEFKKSLQLYLPQVANTLSKIISMKEEVWTIPPVRLTRDGQARVLVPAYCEKRLNNEHVFEFFVYQPRASFKIGETKTFTTLYNLFVVSWHFRWEIIEIWTERLMDLQSLGSKADESEIRSTLAEFQLDYGRILLDALNRKLDSPRKIEKQFDDDKDISILKRIMDQEKGLWNEYAENMESGISNNDLSITIEYLLKLRDLNKTIIVLTLKRLNELAIEREGNLLE